MKEETAKAVSFVFSEIDDGHPFPRLAFTLRNLSKARSNRKTAR